MDARKLLTAKEERELDFELASKLLDMGVDPIKLDSMSEMLLASLDFASARELAGLELPRVDPLTGLVLDPTPEFVVERTGLEELDVQEIHRHRYDGQYPGEPRSHFLGGSNDITFGNGDYGISKSYNRLKDNSKASDKQKLWRDAYHQVGFIASWLNLPEPVKEDICRAYADLRKEGKVKRGPKSLENLLGLLTYVACKIHRYPQGFDDVEEAIDELYDLSISRSDVTRDIVRAFNMGPIRFGIEKKKSGKKYLQRWQLTRGKATKHRSLGQI